MNRALLVGINNYPDPNKLNGCVNDVTDMAHFLVDKCGFKMNDIRLLTDARATAKNIRTRITWMLKGLKKGDRILFHYSGHGAQVATRDAAGEADKFDEVICPVDFDFDNDDSMIRDKEFVKLFSKVPVGVEFIWVSDSCFSGGLTRGFMKMPKGVSEFKIKTIHIPADIAWRNDTAKHNKVKVLGMKGAAVKLNAALISGCSETQESADAFINNRPNGALTFYLLDVLKSNGGSTIPLTQVVKKTHAELIKNDFTQDPELLGSKEIAKKAFMQ